VQVLMKKNKAKNYKKKTKLGLEIVI